MKAHSTATSTRSTVERMLKVARDNPELIPSDLATRFTLSVETVRKRLKAAGITVASGRSERTGRRR